MQGKLILYWSGETAVFVSFSQPLKDFSTFSESSKQVTLLRLREKMEAEFCCPPGVDRKTWRGVVEDSGVLCSHTFVYLRERG